MLRLQVHRECSVKMIHAHGLLPGGRENEYVNKHPAKQMDFIGGWTPTLSLINGIVEANKVR